MADRAENQDYILSFMQGGSGRRAMAGDWVWDTSGPSVTLPLSWLGIGEEDLYAMDPRLIAMEFRIALLMKWYNGNVARHQLEACLYARKQIDQEESEDQE